MNTTIKHTVFMAMLTIAMLVAAHTATAGRVERFVVVGAVGAGIGQAVGHNTEATLIGAATALLVDGYLHRSFPGTHHQAHRPAQHNSHYRYLPSCAARQVTTTVIYLPRGPRPARHHVYRYPHKKEHQRHGSGNRFQNHW